MEVPAVVCVFTDILQHIPFFNWWSAEGQAWCWAGTWPKLIHGFSFLSFQVSKFLMHKNGNFHFLIPSLACPYLYGHNMNIKRAVTLHLLWVPVSCPSLPILVLSESPYRYVCVLISPSLLDYKLPRLESMTEQYLVLSYKCILYNE